jgi:hypothetical protein
MVEVVERFCGGVVPSRLVGSGILIERTASEGRPYTRRMFELVTPKSQIGKQRENKACASLLTVFEAKGWVQGTL